MIPPIGYHLGHGLIKIICFPFIIGLGLIGGIILSIQTLIWWMFNKISLEETHRQVFSNELSEGTIVPLDMLKLFEEYISYLIYDW